MENLEQQLQQKIDLKTKPLGSLGALEKIAFKIGKIQNTLNPELTNPALVVFAGDHGIAKSGVSAFPQEVTFQMVLNFLNGGAAVNVFSRQNDFDLKVVDAGVNFDFESNPLLINAKAGKGTENFLEGKAMTKDEFDFCIQKGRQVVEEIAQSGSNVIGFGEMGIGNTSSSAMLMSYLLNLPIEDCVGRGTGVDDAQLKNKLDTLKQAKNFHGDIYNPEEIMTTFGGFEMAQMCGAMLEAYEQKMVILVDGFIASNTFLVAYRMNPSIINNAIFCHLSNESGHKILLDHLEATPLLNLGMRLGEGTGCTVAYPIIQSAVNFLNEMASFESAGVSDKEN